MCTDRSSLLSRSKNNTSRKVVETKPHVALNFLQVLSSVRSTQLNALKNGDLPFTKLVEALGVTRSPAYNPVFQAMLALNEGSGTPGSASAASRLNFQHISAEVRSFSTSAQHLHWSKCMSIEVM